ncbi:MAG: hypothetical protein GTO08_00390 [Deltaproteobacteria bacterium]|nr:hypothetical protein [Deltaproteobacteria bacterium]
MAFLIVALFLGAYLYIRHDTLLHEAMIGGSGANVARHTSEEYEKYFGQAPEVSVAECEGLVIFFPTRGSGDCT